jgi:tetraacyldisaccharide 4'-kinase
MRFLLLPFSWIYAIGIFIRNLLFDIGILKSNIVRKSIGIGNLSMGGTGKTPLTQYLAQWLIENDQIVYILSRGYKRSTNQNILVKESHLSHEVGDEPLMYKKRFKNKINVLVSKNRWLGSLDAKKNNSNAFLLFDDVYQHRKVVTDFSIITTPYNDLFDDDILLPAGRLREPKRNVNRASCILVTRCPENMSQDKRTHIKDKLSKYNKPLFFSSISYEPFECFGEKIRKISSVLLVTGIAKNENLIAHIENTYETTTISYPDHYRYTMDDIKDIHQKFNSFASEHTIILTTEKDMVRMLEFEEYIDTNKLPMYYQPISIDVHNEKEFTSLIKEYVGKI